MLNLQRYIVSYIYRKLEKASGECFCTQYEKSNGVPCICPHNPLFQMIQSESIRPGADFHIFIHDVSTSPAHGGSLDARESSIPVSPEEDPCVRNPKETVNVDTTVCFYEDKEQDTLHNLLLFS